MVHQLPPSSRSLHRPEARRLGPEALRSVKTTPRWPVSAEGLFLTEIHGNSCLSKGTKADDIGLTIGRPYIIGLYCVRIE